MFYKRTIGPSLGETARGADTEGPAALLEDSSPNLCPEPSKKRGFCSWKSSGGGPDLNHAVKKSFGPTLLPFQGFV